MLELGGPELPPRPPGTPRARREGCRRCTIERRESRSKKACIFLGNLHECRIRSVEFYSKNRGRYNGSGGTVMGASSLGFRPYKLA